MWITYEDKIIKPNLAFALYFTTMFCLYTKTYIQLAAQMALLGFVLLDFIYRKVIYKRKLGDLSFYLIWFGGLTLLLFLSKFYWAVSVNPGSKTMLTVFRIFVMGFAIFLYVDSKEKAFSILQSLIIAAFVMCVVALITTPLSGYGQADIEKGFGAKIGQHRNQIGGIVAPLTIICYSLWKEFKLKCGLFFTIFFGAMIICTGSRSSLAQCVLCFVLYALIAADNISYTIRNVFILFILGSFALVMVYFVPFMHDNIWDRMLEVVNSVVGDTVSDNSILGRAAYKTIAFEMFKQKPILGFGLDGFYCYLRDNPQFVNGGRIQPVYSHCNYAELAANLGSVGLVIWYGPLLCVFINAVKQIKNSKWNTLITCTWISIFISDYARIPWQTHLSMYFYFVMLLLSLYTLMNKE